MTNVFNYVTSGQFTICTSKWLYDLALLQLCILKKGILPLLRRYIFFLKTRFGKGGTSTLFLKSH